MLCKSLTYEQGLPRILGGEEIQQYTVAYTPPFDEFEVFKVDMPTGASTLLPASLVRPLVLTFAVEESNSISRKPQWACGGIVKACMHALLGSSKVPLK